jgi:hypothetical protein
MLFDVLLVPVALLGFIINYWPLALLIFGVFIAWDLYFNIKKNIDFEKEEENKSK